MITYKEFANNIVYFFQEFLQDYGNNNTVAICTYNDNNSVYLEVEDIRNLLTYQKGKEIVLRALEFFCGLLKDKNLREIVEIESMEQTSSPYRVWVGIDAEPNYSIKLSLFLPDISRSNTLADFIDKLENLSEADVQREYWNPARGPYQVKKFKTIDEQSFKEEIKKLIDIKRSIIESGFEVEEYLEFVHVNPSDFSINRKNIEMLSTDWEIRGEDKVRLNLKIVCNHFGKDLAKAVLLEEMYLEKLLHFDIFDKAISDNLKKEVDNPIFLESIQKSIISSL